MNKTFSELIFRFYEILKLDGPAALPRSIRHFFRNRRGVRQLYISDCGKSDAEPKKLIYVDPRSIKYEAGYKGRFYSPGDVYAGRWDLFRSPFSERKVVESLVDHFENGVPWEDTKIFQLAQFRINHGMNYRGCSSTHEIYQHLCNYDGIYDKMSLNGYKTQSELHSKDGEAKHNLETSKDDYQPYLDEIGVSIDRNGNFLWQKEGQHRLCIAQILGVEVVPVQVHLRHIGWQKVRNEIRKKSNKDNAPVNLNYQIEHPDLIDIVPPY
jgi:hypothetical protein